MSPARRRPAARKWAGKAAPRRAAKPSIPATLPTEPPEAAPDLRSVDQRQAGGATLPFFPDYERLADFGRDNVEALLQSYSAAGSRLGRIGSIWLDLARNALHSGAAAAHALGAARTMQDIIAVQTRLAQAMVDRPLADGARIAELSAEAATATAAPLRARAEAALRLMAGQVEP